MKFKKTNLTNLTKKIENHINLEQWTKARVLIKLALKINPKNHWFLTRLALTYYEQHNYKKSFNYNKKAKELAPHCPLVLWDYSGTLEMLGRYKEALIIFKRLVKKRIDSIAYGQCGEGINWARSLVNDCLYRIGECYRKQGNIKKAIKFYIKYIQGLKYIQGRKTRISSIYSLSEISRDLKELQKVTKKRGHTYLQRKGVTPI